MASPVTKSFSKSKKNAPVKINPRVTRNIKRFANRLNRARVNQAIREADWGRAMVDEAIATDWDY